MCRRRRRNIRGTRDGARCRRAPGRTGDWSNRRSRSRSGHSHQLTVQVTVAGAASCVENSQNKSQNEKNPGQPTSEFGQYIGCLRAENVLGDTPAKGRAKTLTFRPLHQNDQGHQHRNQHVDSEENVDENIHWERTISAVRAPCKRSTRHARHPASRMLSGKGPLGWSSFVRTFVRLLGPRGLRLSARLGMTHARSSPTDAISRRVLSLSKSRSQPGLKLQSFVIHRDGAESVRWFFR